MKLKDHKSQCKSKRANKRRKKKTELVPTARNSAKELCRSREKSAKKKAVREIGLKEKKRGASAIGLVLFIKAKSTEARVGCLGL